MSIDNRLGRKVPSYADKDKVPGYKRDAGPHIGIVKNNVDPTRAGRLQVFIPNFGGDEQEQSHWITVGYANPYMGAARTPSVTTVRSQDNSFKTVNHSYGMWFTPPDIGNQVLVIFIDGDANHGYWFACVMPDLSHWAIPGQAGADNLETPLDSNLAAALTKPPYPSVEFNETNKTLLQKWSNFLQINKAIHEDQVKTLLKQGLEDDKIRGVVSSSSQRESPSKVFGISTPGNNVPGAIDHTTGQVTAREGGHTFVMDDGDSTGIDQLIRLRSAGGHQILMNDSEEVIYIGNANGNSWMEFTKEGKILFYGKNDIDVRTQGSFNLHADKDINMNAGGNINMWAKTTFKQQAPTINIKATTDLEMYGQKVGLGSGSTLNLSAATDGGFLAGGNLTFFGTMLYLNTAQPPSVPAPANIPVVSHPEVSPKQFGPYTKWEATSTISTTIPTPIPTHEPFAHTSGKGVSTGSITKTARSSQQIAPAPTPIVAPTTGVPGGQPGPINAVSAGLDTRRVLSPTNPGLATQPRETSGLGPLTAKQLTALKAQIAKSESNFNYQAVNSIYYMGKYQFGYQALQTFGYAKPNVTSNYQLASDGNGTYWTGKDGITSAALWLTSPDVQESAMNDLLQQNYAYLSSHRDLNGNPVVDSSSDPADVAGKLAICHLLGGHACVKWTDGQNTSSDAYGTTGTTYYNLGVYSVDVIAPSLTA